MLLFVLATSIFIQTILIYSVVASCTIEQITPPLGLGEEPHWDNETQVLYFVDVKGKDLFKYDPQSGDITSLHFDDCENLDIAIPVKGYDNLFLVGIDRRLTLLEWNGENSTINFQIYNSQFKYLTSVEPSHPSNRFNDGKADKNGRLWIGTLDPQISTNPLKFVPDEATLYRVIITKNSNAEVTPAISPVTVSNGLAWNKANNKFYYIDTATRKIVKYDYDADEGTIKNKQLAFDFEKNGVKGYPDGMTIDENDHLWVAVYGGGSVIKVNPQCNQLLQTVIIPTTQVTSTMFGGPNLDDLYVTTAKEGLSPEELQQQPQAGAVFRIKNLGVRGYLPPYKVAID
ncbi:regucalcin-like [Chrysoperla carnea]|uniref:regucalcin-like n=1 Tax=Chrysoperla carnea TaxID=189513 RepID=UPI001D0609DE|nr:regucalcin-like [Chrysoperla carnea]